MTPIETVLSELELKAKAATPGPWETSPDVLPRIPPYESESSLQVRTVDSSLSSVFGHRVLVPHGLLHGSDAEFIAAANPHVVFALVACLREHMRWSGSNRGLGDTAVLASIAALASPPTSPGEK
jgi:hypothetical protein